jgi:hypothetical protein
LMRGSLSGRHHNDMCACYSTQIYKATIYRIGEIHNLMIITGGFSPPFSQWIEN